MPFKKCKPKIQMIKTSINDVSAIFWEIKKIIQNQCLYMKEMKDNWTIKQNSRPRNQGEINLIANTTKEQIAK